MEKLDIILLAAGDSVRYGKENKLTALIDGRPMFEYAFETAKTVKSMIDCSCSIIAVSQFDEIERYCRQRKMAFIRNSYSTRGISYSIKLGLYMQEELRKADADVMFMVCDQPYLSAESVCRFITEWKKSQKGLACMMNSDGQSGNPCIFSAAYKDELLSITGDRGGKMVIKKHPEDVFYFKVSDDRQLRDIDEKNNWV